jgi:LemA protein
MSAGVVRRYAKQEETVFGEIARARSALLSAGSPQEKIAANQRWMAHWEGC